jgi:hypothetical protein
MRNATIALLFCTLGGCITPQERTAVFNPAELAPYSRTGTGIEKVQVVPGTLPSPSGPIEWKSNLAPLLKSKPILPGLPGTISGANHARTQLFASLMVFSLGPSQQT